MSRHFKLICIRGFINRFGLNWYNDRIVKMTLTFIEGHKGARNQKLLHQLSLKGATSQVAGSPAVLDRTVIVLDQTVIVLDQTVIVLDQTVIVLDRTAITITVSSHFLRPGGGSDRLWLLRNTRHTSTPALPTLSCLSGDRYVCKTLPRAGLFPGTRSCAFKVLYRFGCSLA